MWPVLEEMDSALGKKQADTIKFEFAGPPVLLESVAWLITAIIALSAMILNTVVIWAFLRDQRLQVVFNLFVFHLAIADLTYCE
ncbi:hypothetical protein PoB_000292800 [Plakobranchus ocellatus]|uniref:G-protein coupled receptors family 1 profile domain-containing protein n=1 Tax=Plakobranchus ocellatus TaxID=259542 RepID=A0AAV3Y242_9GAST|nr:hypothetical protein PoB_000292800 [Plakobranchus ocellatus]